MSDRGSKLPERSAQPGDEGGGTRPVTVADLRARASVSRTSGSHQAVSGRQKATSARHAAIVRSSGRHQAVGAPLGAGSQQPPGTSAPPLSSWRPSARLEAVERYDRFEILGRIGRGGMAEILLARERSLAGGSRHLVIKRVLPEVKDSDELLHMFLDETRVVMGLSHPNLCQIYEVGEHDGSWFIAMEWVNGATLNQLLRRAIEQGDVDHAVIARVIAQTADALHYAHTARDEEGRPMQLVHRDVSPHNVMIAFDGRVKLLDFGIAKSSATTHKTEAGVVKGKICYMAPEQWRSQPLDGRTDVFALGACLYEALSGRVVFKRETQSDVMRAALEGEVPPLRTVAPDVPAALAEIAHRALQVRPEDRFQSAREMSDALERFLSDAGAPVSSGRVSEYARRLFSAEVRLGPVLERSLRGAQLAPSENMFLPPLPQSLLASALPVPLPFAFASQPPERERAAELEAPPSEREGRPTLRPRALTARIASLRPIEAELPPTSLSPPPSLTPPTPPTRAASSLPEVTLDHPTSLVTTSDSPARTDEPPQRELPTLNTETPRQLARTLSLRVGARARRVAIVVALVAAAIPIAIGVRALLAPEPPARMSATRELAQPRVGSGPSPAYSVMPPMASEPPLAPSITPVEREPGLSGRLSINTRPWSTVYLGKRLLGTTPLADVPVPRGALTLRMVDRHQRVHVRRVPASKSPSRSVHFEFEPAKLAP